MIRQLSRLALLIPVAGVLACQTADSGKPEEDQQPPADLEAPGYLGPLPRVALEEELEVDGFLPDLGLIRWFGTSTTGTMAVSQARDHLIRLIDGGGSYLGSVGGGGGGPGGGPRELRLPGGTGWMGDTLWVSDVTLGRVTIFSSEMELVRTLPPLAGARPGEGEEERFPTYLTVAPVAVYPGDTLLVAAADPVGGSTPAAFAQGTSLLRLSSDGVIQTRVLQLPEREGPAGGLFVWDRAKASGTPAPDEPSAPTWLSHVSPHGERAALVTTHLTEADGGYWRLKVVDARGEILVDRGFPYQSGSTPSELVAGSDHRIWVRLDDDTGAPFWLVLNSEGAPQARVPVPQPGQVRLLAADASQVVMEKTDEFGGLTLVVYRLGV